MYSFLAWLFIKKFRVSTVTYKAILPDPDISGLNRQTGKFAYFQYPYSLSDRKKSAPFMARITI